MSADRLLSVEEARASVLGRLDGPVASEEIPAIEALGRVLAGPLVAAVSLPPWPNSAMDGYAVVAADVAGAAEDAPVRLAVIGEARAGAASTATVRPGAAVRIATGAPIPDGADAVVQVELTTPLGPDGRPSGPRGRDATGPLPTACLVHAAVARGAAIRAAASDLSAGTTLLEAGDVVGPAAVGIAAGSGLVSVAVRRRVRVAVLATGDEIVPAGDPLGPASIPDANGPGLAALAAADGCEVVRLGIAPDTREAVVERLRDGIDRADLVVVSGGVSVGPYDVVRTAFETVGDVSLWRVAVQPGKPFAFGVADRAALGLGAGRVPLFGLPGNPVSSYVTYELFVRPAVRALLGRRTLVRPVERAVLEDATTTSHGRRAYLRVTATRDADGVAVRDAAGRVRVRLAGAQGSHMLSGMLEADGLAIVAEEVDVVTPGDEVGLWWIDGRDR